MSSGSSRRTATLGDCWACIRRLAHSSTAVASISITELELWLSCEPVPSGDELPHPGGEMDVGCPRPARSDRCVAGGRRSRCDGWSARGPGSPECVRVGPRCGRSAASSRSRTRPRRGSTPRAPRSFHLRPGLLHPAGDLLLVTLDVPPGRHLAGEAVPDSTTSIADPAVHTRPGPLANSRSSRASWASLNRGGEAEPAERTARGPPLSQARRDRCTERTLTRSSIAITELGSPTANPWDASIRISSRNCRRSSLMPRPAHTS